MTDKAIGYVLLLIGAGILIAVLFSVYSVITRQSHPVRIFDFPGISLDLSQAARVSLPAELQDAGVQIDSSESKPQELLSGDILNQSMNFFAYIVLMGIIANVGFKIAMLGSNMTKPLIVKMKQPEKSILVPKAKNPVASQPQNK